MYVSGNPKTKKAVKGMVKQRLLTRHDLIAVGLEPPAPSNGVVYLEGPHYPQPHRWYAKATIEDDVVIKLS